MTKITLSVEAANAIISEPPKLSSPDPPEEVMLEKTRKYSIIEGMGAAVASGVGESYITAFAVAINSSNATISLLTAIPNLLAPISQAFTPKRMEKYGRKSIVVSTVFLQACMWLAIALIAFLFMQGFEYSPYLLIIFYTVYAALGNFMSPAWTSWMGDIIPKNKGEYWAKRSAICSLTVVVTTLGAGIFLDAFKDVNLMLSFAVVFITAFLGRSFSSYLFTKHYEPKLKLPAGYYFSFGDFVKKIRATGNNFGRYTLFITMGLFAGYMAWPFIPVYMLRELHFDYTTFIIVTIVEILATIVTFQFWGKYVDKNGDLKALRIAAIGLCLVPILWALSSNIYYLIGVQIFRGVIGGAFAIATTNFLFDAVTPQRRSLCSAYLAILNGVGIFFGSITGGILLSFNFGINPFIFIFLAAGVVRLCITAFMLPKIKEVRKNEMIIDGGNKN